MPSLSSDDKPSAWHGRCNRTSWNTLREHSILPAIVNRSINASVGRYIVKFVKAFVTAWAIEIPAQLYFYRVVGEKLSRMHCSNVIQSHLHEYPQSYGSLKYWLTSSRHWWWLGTACAMEIAAVTPCNAYATPTQRAHTKCYTKARAESPRRQLLLLYSPWTPHNKLYSSPSRLYLRPPRHSCTTLLQ